jgi:hypothetical protein
MHVSSPRLLQVTKSGTGTLLNCTDTINTKLCLHIVTRLPSQGRVRRSQVVLTPTRRLSWYPRRVIKGSGFLADYSLVVTCLGS